MQNITTNVITVMATLRLAFTCEIDNRNYIRVDRVDINPVQAHKIHVINVTSIFCIVPNEFRIVGAQFFSFHVI